MIEVNKYVQSMVNTKLIFLEYTFYEGKNIFIFNIILGATGRKCHRYYFWMIYIIKSLQHYEFQFNT